METKIKSNVEDVNRLVQDEIRSQNLTDYVKATVSELPDGSTKIEAWFADDEEQASGLPSWIPMAEFLDETFGGDGAYENVSQDGSDNGSHVEYVVR